MDMSLVAAAFAACQEIDTSPTGTHAPMDFHALRANRNDPCPCGSGLKFKKCCIDKLKTRPEAKEQPCQSR